jgi:molecular chaperone HtpG
MGVSIANKSSPTHEIVDVDSIRVGKDVIEILTSGMYVSPVTIYREYIQNAADSIDATTALRLLRKKSRGVTIDIDHANRCVAIRDNGTGISSRDAVSVLLAIGDSSKRGTTARGFRGVGRLSGLAYCRELEFRTKVSGEDKTTIITWDCRGLREHLGNSAFKGDLRRIISEAVTVSMDHSSNIDDHFFEVNLKDIARLRNDILLNESIIAHYLSQVGPLPFAPQFSFAEAIERHLQAHVSRIPLELKVQGVEVFRPYTDEIKFPGSDRTLRIKDIECIEFPDVDGATGAVGWIGHHEYTRSIPPSLGVRSLRARFGDIQVGEANLCDDSFKESRFNGWTVGELHIVDRRIVPNARRDNFEVNHHYSNMLVQLGPIAASIALRCRTASLSRNTTQIVENTIKEIGGRLRQRRSFDRGELSRLRSSLLRARTITKRISDDSHRRKLETKLDRLIAALKKVTPKRGVSIAHSKKRPD